MTAAPTTTNDRTATTFTVNTTYVAKSATRNYTTGKKINSQNDGAEYVVVARSACYVTVVRIIGGVAYHRAKRYQIKRNRYGQEFVKIGTAGLPSWNPQS